MTHLTFNDSKRARQLSNPIIDRDCSSLSTEERKEKKIARCMYFRTTMYQWEPTLHYNLPQWLWPREEKKEKSGIQMINRMRRLNRLLYVLSRCCRGWPQIQRSVFSMLLLLLLFNSNVKSSIYKFNDRGKLNSQLSPRPW